MGSPATVPSSFAGGTSTAKPKINPIFLIFGCTIFAAVAQVLLKFGALHPMPAIADVGLLGFLNALLHNWILIGGYSLHACNAALLILALREGELSVLYPIYALSYIWVDLLSLHYFHEEMNVWKAAGIALIIGGVAVLGKASSK